MTQFSRSSFSARPLTRRRLVAGGAALAATTRLSGAVRPALAQSITSDVELHLPFNPFGEDVVLHPHRSPNWGPFWVTMPYIWSGLLRFTELGAVENDLAESVTPNDDGSAWTAVIREDAAFANGDPVLAEHVIASWKAAIAPAAQAPMGSYLADIASYDDFIHGASSDFGATATDERTIEITLSRPVADFPSRLATFVYAVVHPGFLTPGDEPMAVADASAGPWRLSAQGPASFTLTPNPHYWDEPSPSITSIVWEIAPGGGTDQYILDQYRQGTLAVADVPVTLLADVRADERMAQELVEISDYSSTLTLAMDFNQKPFNDPQVRKAVAQAIDREAWATEIQGGAFVPTRSFTPPVLAAIANYRAPEGPAFDAEAAAGLIEAAGVLDDASLPEMVWFTPATASLDEQERTAKLVEMISANTGLEIVHDTALTREQINAARQDVGGLQLELVHWWLDSATPALLGVTSQGSDFNSGYINWRADLAPVGEADPGADAARFDELVSSAEAELDEDARNAAYAEAEQLLLDNVVYVPLGNWQQRFVQKPWLQGTRQGPWTGSTPLRIDKDVTVNGDM